MLWGLGTERRDHGTDDTLLSMASARDPPHIAPLGTSLTSGRQAGDGRTRQAGRSSPSTTSVFLKASRVILKILKKLFC